MRGSWHQQKLDTIGYDVNYDYFTPLYDGNIPTSILVEGFHTDDRSRQNPLGVQATYAPNLGLNRQHPEFKQGGYYLN